jgi:two-component system sensor histidine kinase KdpD
MLQEAGVLQDIEGRDVVVGVAETHGRFETTTLLASFERLPRRRILRDATTFEDFDLDAALARRPALLLLDELAHTNAPGSRHNKRWQDAEELLLAGIDVYTTLNVQHVESLNDVVEQITGVTVGETVPDSFIDRADDIKLIDLPPDDLLERLQNGKARVSVQAQRTLDKFFRKGNLIALRELALRKTAEHVDTDMLEWRKAHGIETTWAAADRVLVCVGPSPSSANLLRVGRRMAAVLRAPWFAVNVETPATLRLGPNDRGRLSQHLRLAEELGAEAVTLAGDRPAREILAFAREQNVTKIVVGKPRAVRWRDRLRRSFVDDLLVESGNIDIYATVGEAGNAAVEPPHAPPARRQPVASYAAALGTVLACTAVASALFGPRDLADIVMTYLLGIVVVSMRFGFWPSIVGALLSVLAFDYCFIPPFLAFSVADLRHLVTFGVMLLVAVVIAGLTQRVRDEAEVAIRSERRTANLYMLSRELSRTEGLKALRRVAARHVERVFESPVALFTIRPTGDVETDYMTDGATIPLEVDEGIIRWVHSRRESAGIGTATLSDGRGLYLPLISAGPDGSVLGVLGIYPQRHRFEDPEQQRLAHALAMQIAMAIERASLAEETEQVRLQARTEQIRSALLRSVSHDLRTPLAVMKGAATALADEHGPLAPTARKELTHALVEETERLDRLVRNLLDMTRLESGAVRVKKEWQPVQEVAGAAFNRMERRLAGRQVTVAVPADLLAPFDGVLIEQVLVNLLENAAKYTCEGSPVDLVVTTDDGVVIFGVSDRGPGVPETDRERIFDKFYRGSSERTADGVGLGLTICRAIVATHGGDIWVEDRDGGGAAFRFSLPLEGTPPTGGLPEIRDDRA